MSGAAEGGRETPSRPFSRRASDASLRLSGAALSVQLKHQENVYSYFKFMCPVEEKKAPDRMTYTKVLAYLLVFGSIALQFTLLYAIFDKVVNGDIKWRNKILNPSGETFEGSKEVSSFLGFQTAKCNPGGALCFKENGTVTCAPPTVQLTGRWDELDTDGDGIWTREEVEAAQEDLQCKYAVNPVEVFDVFVRFLKDRENVIWLHPDVKEGKAIPKPYFTYAAGDIIMCGYRNTDMCANVLRMGAFDGPLKLGTAPRVGETIDSALDYCYALLEQGGTCERTLPSTYSVWRKNGEEQCGGPDYDKFVYTHPVTGKQKSMLVVDYEARKDYSRAQSSTMFLTYKSIIIGLFTLAMFAEFKDIMDLVNWIICFPSAKDFGEDAVLAEKNDDGIVTFTVQGISMQHRMTMACLTFVRFIMLVILIIVGLNFLLKDTNYIDLLLNAVGFVFVVEISGCLYLYFLHPSLRDECECVEPMQVPVLGFHYLAEHPALRDIIGMVLLVLVVMTIMLSHHRSVVQPLWQALECTCLGEGAQCMEATKFNEDFWLNYWTVEVPNVFDQVADLKKGVDAGAIALPKVATVASQAMTWHLGGKIGRENRLEAARRDEEEEEIEVKEDRPRRHTRGGHHHKHGHGHLLNGDR